MPRFSKHQRDLWKAAVGTSIRMFRARIGISQEALGEKSGLHRTFISDLERGKRNATLTSLLDVARALGTTPSEILQIAEKEMEPGIDQIGKNSPQ